MEAILNQVRYKIFKDLKNLNEPFYSTSDKGDICFHKISHEYITLNENSGLQYIVRKVLDEKIVKWYHKNLNEIGLRSRLVIDENDYNFYINYQGQNNFYKMLAILTALRYLEESIYPEMIKWAFEKSKITKIGFFTLFQLMHHTTLCDGGHTFLISAKSPYSKISHLISLKEFEKKLSGSIGAVNSLLKGDFGQPELDKTKIIDLIKKDKVNELVKFMSGETLIEEEDVNFGMVPTFLGA